MIPNLTIQDALFDHEVGMGGKREEADGGGRENAEQERNRQLNWIQTFVSGNNAPTFCLKVVVILKMQMPRIHHHSTSHLRC